MCVKYRQNGKRSSLVCLKELTALFKSKASRSKNNFLASLDKLKLNPKEFWRYARSSNKDGAGIPSIRDSGWLVDNEANEASLFNSYFKSIFSPPKVGQLPHPPARLHDSMLDIEVC